MRCLARCRVPRTRARGRRNRCAEPAGRVAARGARDSRGTSAPQSDRERLTELDRVLDKISQLGIDSLTGDERRILEERSRELRKIGLAKRESAAGITRGAIRHAKPRRQDRVSTTANRGYGSRSRRLYRGGPDFIAYWTRVQASGSGFRAVEWAGCQFVPCHST